MSGDIQRPYTGPDDGDPPFGEGPSLDRAAARPWETEEERQRLVAAGLWGPAEVAEFQRRSLEQRLCAAWHGSSMCLGKLVVLAADAYALGAAVSLTGIVDVALVDMCERYVRERIPAPTGKKMPDCPACGDDELGAISLGEGPRVHCYRCGWCPEPANLPANVREAALAVLSREAACIDAARRGE